MDTFQRLPDHCDRYTRARVYADYASRATDDGLTDMLLSQDYDAIAAAIPHLTDPIMLDFASKQNGVAHWPLFLDNMHTTPDILRKIAERDDLYGRYGDGLLKHPNTPDDVRERVLKNMPGYATRTSRTWLQRMQGKLP